MAYKRVKWKKGDKITSARLNNIEDGIEEVLGKVSELKTEPIEVEKIGGNATVASLSAKINELINALK
jgi:hypothetical protein